MHVEDNIRAGMSPEEARRQAILKLGGVEAARQTYRDQLSVPFVEHLFQDLRYATRQLARSPGLAVTAISALALGTAAALAIYAFADAALIRPLPYRDQDRLVEVTETNAQIPRAHISYLNYLDWKRLNTAFESFDIHRGRGYTLRTDDGPEPIRGVRVSVGFFRTLGVRPALGRDSEAGEDVPGAPKVVLLSHRTWQGRFLGRSDILGQTLVLDDEPHTVIGVLPEDFRFPLRGRAFTDADTASTPKVAIINRTMARKYFPGEDPIGKRFGDTALAPDSIKEIVGIVEDIREGPLSAEIWPAVYYPFAQSPDNQFAVAVRATGPATLLPSLTAAVREVDPDLVTFDAEVMQERIKDSPAAYLQRSSAWLVAGFASLALLLGVVGLYGVVSYSVGQRTREIGLRLALGAGRRSVYKLVLGEVGRLTLAGMALGVLGSMAAARLMRSLLFATTPWDPLTLLAVTAVLGAAALLASYLPARRAASVDPIEALRVE